MASINRPINSLLATVSNGTFLRYSAGCLLSVTIKAILTNVFVIYFVLPPFIAYFLVQIVVLFYSFFFHTKITYGNTISLSLFRDFFFSVIAFKVLDYFIFLIGMKFLQNLLKPYLQEYQVGCVITGAIVVSTLLIFLIRFMVYNRILAKKEDE